MLRFFHFFSLFWLAHLSEFWESFSASSGGFLWRIRNKIGGPLSMDKNIVFFDILITHSKSLFDVCQNDNWINTMNKNKNMMELIIPQEKAISWDVPCKYVIKVKLRIGGQIRKAIGGKMSAFQLTFLIVRNVEITKRVLFVGCAHYDYQNDSLWLRGESFTVILPRVFHPSVHLLTLHLLLPSPGIVFSLSSGKESESGGFEKVTFSHFGYLRPFSYSPCEQ